MKDIREFHDMLLAIFSAEREYEVQANTLLHAMREEMISWEPMQPTLERDSSITALRNHISRDITAFDPYRMAPAQTIQALMQLMHLFETLQDTRATS